MTTLTPNWVFMVASSPLAQILNVCFLSRSSGFVRTTNAMTISLREKDRRCDRANALQGNVAEDAVPPFATDVRAQTQTETVIATGRLF
jgi:hypothetical protein